MRWRTVSRGSSLFTMIEWLLSVSASAAGEERKKIMRCEMVMSLHDARLRDEKKSRWSVANALTPPRVNPKFFGTKILAAHSVISRAFSPTRLGREPQLGMIPPTSYYLTTTKLLFVTAPSFPSPISHYIALGAMPSHHPLPFPLLVPYVSSLDPRSGPQPPNSFG